MSSKRLVCLLCLFAAYTGFVSRLEAKEGPNVVVILVDDLGYGDLSCYGATDLKSPEIDTLARDGMRFTRFRANSCVCSPTRAAIMSGMYPDRAGVPGVIRTREHESSGYLSPDISILPKALKNLGYESAIIGKWHLGLESPNLPNERGFDYFYGFLGDMMDDYYTHRRHDINYMRENEKTIDPEGHATEIFTAAACDYLNKKSTEKKPFFLYLSYNAPHGPIQPPKEYLDRVLEREPSITEKRAKLVALVEHLDACVGRVLKTLDDTGLSKNTLVVFNSDNGGSINEGGTCGPHRDGKGSMYEGGLAVPFIVRWPERIKPGTVSEAEGMSMDLFPTVLSLAGADLDAPKKYFPQRIDGVDLCPVFFEQKIGLPERTLYFVRREVWLNSGGAKTIEALIDGRWKVLQNSAFGPIEFFDLAEDPLEKTDLSKSGKHRETFVKTAAKLRRQIQEGGRVPWFPPE